MNKNRNERVADNMRILSAAMVEKAKSGHPGGAMGGADFLSVLYSEFLNFDPDDFGWNFRDRFFLDPGHMSPMLYSILTLVKSLSIEDIENFRQWQSPTPGHPEYDLKRGIENTSGPLGQGHAMAVGSAIAERFLVKRFGDWMAHKTYTFISDGGVQEEISQGAGRIAGFLGLNNLIMFYDSNDIQLSTSTDAVSVEDTASKYKSWGWRVYSIDGNDYHELVDALTKARDEKDKPVLIIGKTIMGKGCLDANGKSFEAQVSTHGQPISKAGADFGKTLENLGGDASNPFKVFPDVEKYFEEILETKRTLAKEKKALYKKWQKENPELDAKLNNFLEGVLPEIDYSRIKQKENIPSRGASSKVLEEFALQVENMIVMSADLANSDKTDGFLKKTKAFSYQNFEGAFLHAGVSELTMGAIANGMALHGGVVPVCGTFFVFSDYMKPAVRMAALMELPVKYVWTHDAFRVGEDGPTHQPIEHEYQIRLLEQLKNHSGNPGMLVLRPADAAETTVAWQMAMENKNTPTALLLSRQNIKDLPAIDGKSRFENALDAEKGAYLVKDCQDEPDIILVGNGSEVSTLLEAALMIEKENSIQIRVVSAISEVLFRKQSLNYQHEIIPPGYPALSLSAGLPENLRGLVGAEGKCLGLDHFGYSAPAGVLDEKFGFTPENLVVEIEKYLTDYR